MDNKIPGWITENMSNRQKDLISKLFHKYIEYYQSENFDQWNIDVYDEVYHVRRASWDYYWAGKLNKIADYLKIYYDHINNPENFLLDIVGSKLDKILNYNKFWSDDLDYYNGWTDYIDEKYKVLWYDLPEVCRLLLYKKAEEKYNDRWCC